MATNKDMINASYRTIGGTQRHYHRSIGMSTESRDQTMHDDTGLVVVMENFGRLIGSSSL